MNQIHNDKKSFISSPQVDGGYGYGEYSYPTNCGYGYGGYGYPTNEMIGQPQQQPITSLSRKLTKKRITLR